MTVEEARRLLSITSVPTPENIQKAYRRMAMNSHPDRYRTFPEKAWATRQFIKIKEARDVLVEGFASRVSRRRTLLGRQLDPLPNPIHLP